MTKTLFSFVVSSFSEIREARDTGYIHDSTRTQRTCVRGPVSLNMNQILRTVTLMAGY